MSDIKFLCPRCGQRIEADSTWAGLDLDCPGCNRIIKAPVFSFAEAVTDEATVHALGEENCEPSRAIPALADEEPAVLRAGLIHITVDMESLRASQALKSHGLTFNVSFSDNLTPDEVKGLLTLVALNFKPATVSEAKHIGKRE